MRKLVRLLLFLAVFLGILIGAARATAIRWWRIPDDDPYLEASIAPTLRGGDWVILWRFTPPKQGDLVLCPEPEQPDRTVIGRIAGVAGQRIEVKGSSVLINGRRARSEGSCAQVQFATSDPRTAEIVEQRCQNEELGSRVHERGNVVPGSPPQESRATVGEGEIYLLSDNRLFPYDSRDFGLVERESCTETIVYRLISAKGFSDVQSRLSLIR